MTLANSVYVLALSPAMSERESTEEHGTSRNSTAYHDTVRRVRHPTAPHGAAGSVELPKLNGAGGRFLVLPAFRSWA